MDSLFSAKSYGDLTRYPIGNTVNNQYKILSPLVPVLGGNVYKVEDIISSEGKSCYLIQMEQNVDCKGYQDERPLLKSLSQEKKGDTLGGEFIVETAGYTFLGECLQKVKKEEEYKNIFLPVMEWIEKFHQHRKNFPFLQYYNILIGEKNIIVLGTSFVYNYFKCQNNPYPHLISPNYVNSLRFPQGSKYNPWSDYYPVAIMLWEQFLKHPPSWDDHSMRFQEEVCAGMYTEFIQTFTDSNASYLSMENPLERFKNIKSAPPVSTPSIPAASYTTYSIGNPVPAYEEKTGNSSKLKSLEQENTRLYEKLDEVYQQLEGLKSEAKKKSRLFSLLLSGITGIVLGSVLLLFFLGFRLLSPAQIEEQEKNAIQKNFWHTLGLLQGNKIQEAKSLCESITLTPDHPICYIYLHVLQNIYELTKEQKPERQQEIKKNMMEKLLFLQNQRDRLSQEIERYHLAISLEQIQHWIAIFKK